MARIRANREVVLRCLTPEVAKAGYAQISAQQRTDFLRTKKVFSATGRAAVDAAFDSIPTTR